LLVFWFSMKTTLDLPDELMRAVKIRAAQEDRKLKDMVAELLRVGLDADQSSQPRRGHRVQFPLIRGGHPARPEEELTPERIAEILLADEVAHLTRP
jgi:plasmid stability protein